MISVLFPTIRPELVAPCLESIRAGAGGVPFEVIVVSDVPVTWELQPWVRWIVTARNGVVDAVNVAYRAARGSYVFLTNDETRIEPLALERLYQAALREPQAIWSPQHIPSYPFFYYGKPFVPFVFASKALLDSLGGLLDPAYKGFYADPDLSMRAHAAGVPLRVLDTAVIHHSNNIGRPDHVAAVQQYLAQDRETFRARWDHLGEFCDP